MNSISVIIPSFKNPQYLDLCLKSLTENQVGDNEVIVVLDGFADQSHDVLVKYPDVNVVAFEENRGQNIAHNTGVTLANCDRVLIVNDDNVFGRRWDAQLDHAWLDTWVLTTNQVEPSSSIFKSFVIRDFGRTPDTFDYTAWLDFEESIQQYSISPDGQSWPFCMSKKWYMALGGMDTQFPNGAVTDHDFFLRCEMAGLKCVRTHNCHLYHFGGATMKRNDQRIAEQPSHEYFNWKWGMYSHMNLAHDNSKMPKGTTVRGITF